MPPSTIARIESGANCPRLDTFAQLMAASGFKLAVVDGRHEPMYVDEELEELRDCADRHFPVHLEVEPTPGYYDWHNPRTWWGWHRIAWPGQGARVPTHTYWRRQKLGSGQWGYLTEPEDLARRWQDAT